jgi:hypothetical protein
MIELELVFVLLYIEVRVQLIDIEFRVVCLDQNLPLILQGFENKAGRNV